MDFRVVQGFYDQRQMWVCDYEERVRYLREMIKHYNGDGCSVQRPPSTGH